MSSYVRLEQIRSGKFRYERVSSSYVRIGHVM